MQNFHEDEDEEEDNSTISSYSSAINRSAGRPPVNTLGGSNAVEICQVSKKISAMRRIGMTWKKIAILFDVHINTLSNWRIKNNFWDEADRNLIGDVELDFWVSKFLKNTRQRGEVSLTST
jgi:hypothetical protein